MIGNCTIAERTNGRSQSTHELVAAHLAGDPDASRVWLRSVRALACAIGSFVNVLDPEVVVIGGGIAQSGETLFAPLRQYLAEVEWRSAGYAVEVLPAALGEFAGAIGAARNAMDAEGKAWLTAGPRVS
jgi:glucokinase